MTDEHDNTVEFRTEPIGAGATSAGQESSPNVNPYQAPAYQPDGFEAHSQVTRPAAMGNGFIAWSIALLVFAMLITVVSGGLGLPVLLAVVGGIIRATVMLERQKAAMAPEVAGEVVLIASTFVTFVLMLCSAVAFGTICTSGVLVGGVPYTASALPIWIFSCGAAALALFIFLFVQSTRWRG